MHVRKFSVYQRSAVNRRMQKDSADQRARADESAVGTSLVPPARDDCGSRPPESSGTGVIASRSPSPLVLYAVDGRSLSVRPMDRPSHPTVLESPPLHAHGRCIARRDRPQMLKPRGRGQLGLCLKLLVSAANFNI